MPCSEYFCVSVSLADAIFKLSSVITSPDPGSMKQVSAVPPCSGGPFLVVMRWLSPKGPGVDASPG